MFADSRIITISWVLLDILPFHDDDMSVVVVVMHGINRKVMRPPSVGSLFFDKHNKGITCTGMISLALIFSFVTPSVVNDDFADRIAIIESNYNHLAVGDNYKARGAYQLS